MNEPFNQADKDLDARARRIDLAHEPDFAIGPVHVQPSLRKIAGPEGDAMLEPKVMQVLVALGTLQGAILSRDDLIERCWDGRVVGDTSINRVISLLRSGFKAVCGKSVAVENVPKVGYRLLVLDDADVGHGLASQPPEALVLASGGDARKFAWIGAGVMAVLAMIAVVFALQPSSDAPVRPVRVAMLPISVEEGVDPLYARGLEAELRAQLARVGQLEVTNSDTARQLFEEGLSAEENCERLGADYAWIGGLSVGTDRVSLRAKIIEASSKDTVFREELTSAPDAAQYLPLRAARAVSTALGRPVSGRLPEAGVTASNYGLYLTALGLIKNRGDEQRLAAHTILEKVTEESPDFADGWAGLAKAKFLLPSIGDAMKANRAQALELARYALSLDGTSVDALKVAGMLEDDLEQRLTHLKRAAELDPGDSEAWFWLGLTQRELLLQGEIPLNASERMVEIDPLWPASWRASDLAAEFGQLDRAFELEAKIASAAVTPSQRFLTEARVARLRGDLSQFLDSSARAASTQSDAERRYGSTLQTRMLRLLLGLPLQDIDILPREAPYSLVAQVMRGQLPSREAMQAEGVDAAHFWQVPTLVVPALPLYIQTGRGEELLALYDEAFPDHAAFMAFARGQQGTEQIIPTVSPYLALILRNVGREAEAQQHLDEAESQLATWKAADTGWVKVVIWDLQLAAVSGDNARAIAAVERLPDYAWPYSMGHIDALSIGLIRDDPIYDSVSDLPGVRAVLDPIRAQLTREREEILAQIG